MQLVFFDASALVKRYAQERGTNVLNKLFESLHPSQMTCSTVTILETLSILVRKRNDGRLERPLFEDTVRKFRTEIVENRLFVATSVDDNLLLRSSDFVVKHNLNATDAVILRSALDLRATLRAAGDDLALWTSDKRLVRAAQAEGIAVIDPEVASVEDVQRGLGTS